MLKLSILIISMCVFVCVCINNTQTNFKQTYVRKMTYNLEKNTVGLRFPPERGENNRDEM